MNSVKVDKAIEVPCNKREFYRNWLAFTVPLHKFTPQVVQIAAEFLRHREELSKVVLDESMLMKLLMSSDVRKQITEDCGIPSSTLMVIISKLKKGGFFKDGKINPRFIPALDKPDKFNFMIMFKISD